MFSLRQYYLPITIFLIIFWFCVCSYLLIESAYRWWLYTLPNNRFNELSRKWWIVVLYRLRTRGFYYITQRYSDNLYYLCLGIFTFLVVFAPHLLLALARYLYFNTQKQFKWLIVQYYKWCKIFSFYLDIFLIWFRPYFSILFAKYGILFELPLMFYESGFINVPFLTVNFFIKILSCFLVSIIIFLLIGFFWCIIHEFCIKILIFLFNFKFPRLSISTVPKISSAHIDEFKLKRLLTLPVFARLKILVGLQTINFWASKKILKMVSSNLPKTRRWRYYSKRVKGLYEVITPARMLRLPGWWKYLRLFNKFFSFPSSPRRNIKLNNGNFKFQFFLPKILNSRLNSKTFVLKNFFLKKKKIINCITIHENQNTKLVVPCTKYDVKLSNLSIFFKNTFFKPSKSELISLTLKDSFNYIFDQRFIYVNSKYKHRFRFGPRFFRQSNLGLILPNTLTNIASSGFFVSVFLTKNKINISNKKTFDPFRFLKNSRRITSIFCLKLFLLSKNRKFKKKLRYFNSFFLNKLFNIVSAPRFTFKKHKSLVRKNLIIFKRVLFDKTEDFNLFFIKKHVFSSKFLRFFLLILFNRRNFRLLNNNFFFLRSGFFVNNRSLVQLKLRKNFNLIPLLSTRDYPWWVVYSDLLKNKHIQVKTLAHKIALDRDARVLVNQHASDNITKKIVKKFNVFYKFCTLYRRKRFFRGIKRKSKFFGRRRKRIYLKKARRGVRKMRFFKLLLKRKSYGFRFFFDLNLYHMAYNLKQFFSLTFEKLTKIRHGSILLKLLLCLILIYIFIFDNSVLFSY